MKPIHLAVSSQFLKAIKERARQLGHKIDDADELSLVLKKAPSQPNTLTKEEREQTRRLAIKHAMNTVDEILSAPLALAELHSSIEDFGLNAIARNYLLIDTTSARIRHESELRADLFDGVFVETAIAQIRSHTQAANQEDGFEDPDTLGDPEVDFEDVTNE